MKNIPHSNPLNYLFRSEKLKTNLRSLFIMSCLGSSFFFLEAADKPRPVITIQAGEPGLKASQNLQGIFVEDWCHQVEGGIYGEMLRNRSFDDKKSAKETMLDGFVMRLPDDTKEVAGEIVGWKLIAEKPGSAVWGLEQSKPLNENNLITLKLTVNDASGKVGIYNEGLVEKSGTADKNSGISVKKESSYLFSCFVQSDTPGAEMNVSIETPEGKSLASEKITGISGEWKKFELALNPSESFRGARLVVSPSVNGVYHLDMVSLFPKETWKGRPNGLRKDLMEMVEAMKPAFVRFPGGCFVEGLGIANAWHWKKTIGKVEERPGHWNIWGWRSSDGMGYFEYLQMCEDLGAEPLVVVFCGMAHTVKDGVQLDAPDCVPMDKMGEIVQDALDAIEYANGPETSTWGAKRAAAGHPKPFNLKYIEIGNENHGPEYAERYPLFHDAIKAKYPEMNVVMNSWGPQNFPKNRVPDILDIHRFAIPFWFADAYTMFDQYDRKGFKVYFGEWCANLELPNKESLYAGLHEAAFITGLEKNSDLVVMQSYAPFMNNIGWSKRKPNMINFDLDRVYGTPIYWIQKMYADYKIQTLLNFKAEIPELRPVKTGYAGVGTTDTQAEFKEIVITGPTGEIFNSGSAQKNAYRFVKSGKKSWESNGDLLTQTDSGRQLAIINKEIIGDYTMTFKVRRTNGKNGFNLFFQTMPDGDNSHYFQIGGDGNKTIKAQGDGFTKGDMEKWTMENNRWYEAKLEVKGDEVALAIDNKEIMKVTYRALQTLYPSIGRNEESKEIIVKIVNLSLENQKTHFKIQGAELEPTGKVIVLTSKSPDDQNSLEEPNKVIPQELAVPNVSGDFEYEFPACSVNILRLKQK